MNVDFREVAEGDGTIVLFRGTDIDTDNEVLIAVDHRPAREVAAALERGEHVEAEVEDWQVLSSTPSTPPKTAPKFVVEIHTDNAAFDNNTAVETARILHRVATHVEQGARQGACIDINGNTVGQYRFKEGDQ